MSRRPTGSVYANSAGAVYLNVTLDKRRSFRLAHCGSKEAGKLIAPVIVETARKLQSAGQVDMAVRFCEQAGLAPVAEVPKLVELMDRLLDGKEKIAAPVAAPEPTKVTSSMTVKEFADLWTSGALARRHRGHVRDIDQSDNESRFRNHVFPIVFGGRAIGDTPLDEFTIDHALHVLQQPTLPAGSIRHVAQCLNKLFAMAVYPARVLDRSPLPRGWMPRPNEKKAKSYLLPSDDALLMACTEVPLVRRLFIGFLMREGPRLGKVAHLAWSDVQLDAGDGALASIDRTKNGRPLRWALDPGTAEALRRWQKLCPSDHHVFPAEAVPRSPKRLHGGPISVGQLAPRLRADLKLAGVTRQRLFEGSKHRLPLRAHDLRTSFVTLALANDRTVDWVRRRTGHRTMEMILRYREDADTLAELNPGWFAPLHEAIPELRGLMPAQTAQGNPEETDDDGR